MIWRPSNFVHCCSISNTNSHQKSHLSTHLKAHSVAQTAKITKWRQFWTFVALSNYVIIEYNTLRFFHIFSPFQFSVNTKGVVQRLRNADFGHFWPPPPYVTKRNVSIYPPPVLRNASRSTPLYKDHTRVFSFFVIPTIHKIYL